MYLRIIFLLYFVLLTNSKSDFCSIETTKCAGEPHIGCTGFCLPNDVACTKTLRNCKYLKIVPMTNSLKNLILNEHNKYRNDIAGGHLLGFPTASRMLKMYWDDELAILAEKHVKNCYFEHDKCRSTEKYEYSGQNIAIRMSTNSDKSPPVTNQIEKSIEAWWIEFQLVNKTIAEKLIENYQFQFETGHFFVMIREGQESVGCAIAIYENERYPYNFLLTCNYAETNMLNEQVYDIGSPCNRCNSYGSDFKCDSNYRYLCGNNKNSSQKLKNPFEVLLSVLGFYLFTRILTN